MSKSKFIKKATTGSDFHLSDRGGVSSFATLVGAKIAIGEMFFNNKLI